MGPLLVIGALLAYGFYKWSQQTSPTSPLHPAPTPEGVLTAPLLQIGQSYLFTLTTTLSQAELVAGLTTAGIILTSVATLGTDEVAWTGTFTWAGADASPLPPIPGVSWVSVSLEAQVMTSGEPDRDRQNLLLTVARSRIE